MPRALSHLEWGDGGVSVGTELHQWDSITAERGCPPTWQSLLLAEEGRGDGREARVVHRC